MSEVQTDDGFSVTLIVQGTEVPAGDRAVGSCSCDSVRRMPVSRTTVRSKQPAISRTQVGTPTQCLQAELVFLEILSDSLLVSLS